MRQSLIIGAALICIACEPLYTDWEGEQPAVLVKAKVIETPPENPAGIAHPKANRAPLTVARMSPAYHFTALRGAAHQ